jgi:hypothetical protein
MAMGRSNMPKVRSTQNTTQIFLTFSVPGANRPSHLQTTEVTPDMESSTAYSLVYQAVQVTCSNVWQIWALYRISRRVISKFWYMLQYFDTLCLYRYHTPGIKKSVDSNRSPKTTYSLLQVQGEHKIFPWLQTSITRNQGNALCSPVFLVWYGSLFPKTYRSRYIEL